MESNLSLSDIAAVTNADGFGGNNSWILILLFAMIYGGGFFGNRNGEFGQYATAASQQDILFSSKFADLDNKMDRGFTSLGNGIADATFALNNSVKDGNAAINGNIVNEGRAIQTQIAECCCATKEAIHAEGEATRAMLQQNKIDTLQSQLNNVQMQQAIQNAMCGVPKVNPYMYNIAPSCNCTGLTTI